MLAAPFEPLVPAPAHAMEVIATAAGTVAVEVDADLVAGTALGTAALRSA